MRRADIDPEWLCQRYDVAGATAREIAEETGYSVCTILRHARGLDLNMRPAWPDRTQFDEVWLRHRYVDERTLIDDIAAEAGVTTKTLGRALHRFGLVGLGRGPGRRFDGCRRFA